MEPGVITLPLGVEEPERIGFAIHQREPVDRNMLPRAGEDAIWVTPCADTAHPNDRPWQTGTVVDGLPLPADARWILSFLHATQLQPVRSGGCR